MQLDPCNDYHRSLYLRIQFILSEGLEDPGRPHQAGDGAADGGRETAAVDEVAGAGDHSHGLLVEQGAVLAGPGVAELNFAGRNKLVTD